LAQRADQDVDLGDRTEEPEREVPLFASAPAQAVVRGTNRDDACLDRVEHIPRWHDRDEAAAERRHIAAASRIRRRFSTVIVENWRMRSRSKGSFAETTSVS